MKARMRRVLFVSDACVFGGAERYVLDMAAAARRRDLEPAICWLPCTASPEDLFVEAARYAVDMFHSTLAGPSSHRERRRCLRDALQSFRPDALIVNAAGRPRFWQVCWQARAAGIPAAWVHHMVDQLDPRRVPPQWFGGTMEGPQWWRVPQALRHHLAAKAATVVITSNAADRDRIARWHRVNAAKLRVISPGVDANRFAPMATTPAPGRQSVVPWLPGGGKGDAAFVIGTAARLVPGKGLELLIESTAQLRTRGISATLVIAGQGPLRGTLESLAARRNIAEAVQLAGFVDDMPAFYRRLDVFALSSETESFGLGLTEAMSCARPVVATPTAGARLQIRHRENGWLLADHSAAELTTALATLYQAPEPVSYTHLVSTPLPAVAAVDDAVWLAEEAEEWATCCARAAHRNEPVARLQRSERMRTESWPARLEQIGSIIARIRGTSPMTQSPSCPAPEPTLETVGV